MNRTTKSVLQPLLLILAAACCVSCASITPTRIAEIDLKPLHKHPVCVTLKTTGGIEQGFLADLEVPVDSYNEAVRIAIRSSQVFSGICAAGQPGLVLDIVVFKSRREFGEGQTRLVPTNWRLTNPANRRVLFQQHIVGRGDFKFYWGGQRMVIYSMEAAMRDSIVTGLQGISQLELTGAE